MAGADRVLPTASYDPIRKEPILLLDAYEISDLDDGGATKYYGFLTKDGQWAMMKYDTSAGTIRYTEGASDYTTNWVNRTGLSFDYYNVKF